MSVNVEYVKEGIEKSTAKGRRGSLLMKIGYVINPVAGRRRAVQWIPFIEETSKEQGHRATVYVTNKPGDGISKAIEAISEGCNTVIAVGGDGTVNEVVNGVGDKDITVGVIPAGSGNDFARTLGMPLDLAEAMHCILQGKRKSIDIGTVNGERFVNVASVGFDARVVMETNGIKHRIKGPLAYVIGVFKALATYKPYDMELDTGHGIMKKRAVLIAVANGIFYGGGMKVAPDAILDDGLFDVCLVEGISRLRILRLFPLIYSGRHLLRKEVEYFRAREIRIDCPGGYINSDGEILGPCPANMVLHPKGLTVITP